MPFTINGIGTKFYGNRERGNDGSYVTTEWIVFAYLPVIPIRSLRVLPAGRGTNALIYNSQSYLTQPVPMCWAQIRNVYVFLAGIAAILGGIIWYAG